METHILLAEPDPAARYLLETVFRQRMACAITTATTHEAVIENLQQGCDIALIGTRFPDGDVLELVHIIKTKYPTVPMVMVSAVGDEELTNKALERGALDFINRDDSPKRIKEAINSILHSMPLQEKPDNPEVPSGFSAIIGAEHGLKPTIAMAQRAALSDIPVLLKGESGVGKELFAHAIHEESERSEKPFVAVNCGAIPDNLVESVLFGHEKGAFTGATDKAEGKFQAADSGTLFLDEIGELKQDLQVKILRALQEKEVTPVGGKAANVDVRIISATNVLLEDAVNQGTFREDLYYRLNVLPIDIPPLRERGNATIEALIHHFITYTAKHEGKQTSGITDEALEMLVGYNWPGNVRQLQNALYRAVVLSDHKELDVSDFTHISNALLINKLALDSQSVEAQHNASSTTPLWQQKLDVPLLDATGNFRTIAQIEADILPKALQFYRWNITDTAKYLGYTRATLYNKMKKYGITDPRDQTV